MSWPRASFLCEALTALRRANERWQWGGRDNEGGQLNAESSSWTETETQQQSLRMLLLSGVKGSRGQGLGASNRDPGVMDEGPGEICWSFET